MRESKECLECGGLYFRGLNVTQEQWEGRKYCSPVCAGKANMRLYQAAAKQAKSEEMVALEPAEEKAPVAQVSPEAGRMPIMRELRIVRVGPNPRTVSCEYFELAQRRTCTVLVKRSDKYLRGMKFQMAEPSGELEFSRPWVYTGPAPRRRGRW
jgi:hypothetical protein